MRERTHEEEHSFLLSVLKGNEDAVAFCESMFYICQKWDDWVDGDKEVSRQEKYDLFREAMLEIPRNPFWRRHSPELIVATELFFNDWVDANVLEEENQPARRIAFVLRESIFFLVVQCANLIGGVKWRDTVGPQIRKYIFDEPFEDYEAKL